MTRDPDLRYPCASQRIEQINPTPHPRIKGCFGMGPASSHLRILRGGWKQIK
jgi:hypothetical protein